MAMAATIPHYTVADLEHFPNDGNRYALLDGVLLVTPAPNAALQLLSARLIHILMREIDAPTKAYGFGPAPSRSHHDLPRSTAEDTIAARAWT